MNNIEFKENNNSFNFLNIKIDELEFDLKNNKIKECNICFEENNININICKNIKCNIPICINCYYLILNNFNKPLCPFCRMSYENINENEFIIENENQIIEYNNDNNNNNDSNIIRIINNDINSSPIIPIYSSNTNSIINFEENNIICYKIFISMLCIIIVIIIICVNFNI